MSNNRHAHTPNDSFSGDSGKDASPNPLYLATSQSEHSNLSRHGKKTLAELGSSSRNNDENREKRQDRADRNPPHGQQSYHQAHQSYSHSQHQSQTLPRPGSSRKETELTLDRPDSQTWDRLGRTGVGSLGRNATASSSNHREESPSKSVGSADEKKNDAPAKSMQARSLRLSLGASTDLTKDSRKLPAVNCPEKIILCLDISKELENLSFRMRNGEMMSFIILIKKALGIFLRTKHLINPQHEYALMVLNSSAFWVSDFCRDPVKILTYIENLPNLVDCDSCELSSIFDELLRLNQVKIPNGSDAIPSYTVRVILVYARSQCIPQLNRTQLHRTLESSSCFWIDVLYVHDPPSSENNCEKIFEVLCDLDERGTSYILEVSKNPTRVFDCLAQLLAHPLQRCLQQDVNYNLEPITQN